MILASASPRRCELLRKAGFRFEVIVPEVDELPVGDVPWQELCQENARLKARTFAGKGAWVIAADTLVCCDNRVLGKPKNYEEAAEMLRLLSGRSHQVCTGVCVMTPTGKEVTFKEITHVRFRSLSESQIRAYHEKVDPLDKAGAYGIQEFGEDLVEGIDGSYSNVMGLPMESLEEQLQACGLPGYDL